MSSDSVFSLNATGLWNDATEDVHHARAATDPVQRFTRSYRAATRAALGALVARGYRIGTSRPVALWALLPRWAPELNEWTESFTEESHTWAALLAGIVTSISEQEATRLLHEVERFLVLAQQLPVHDSTALVSSTGEDFLPACACGWIGSSYVDAVEAQRQQEDHEFGCAEGGL